MRRPLLLVLGFSLIASACSGDDGSLARAREQADEHNVRNVAFVKQNVLELDFPDDHVETYLLCLMAMDDDTWGGLAPLLSS